MSLRTLAEGTGFSASFLSQVENGQASPSIASMERIATALGVTLSEFFQTAEANSPAVVRADARSVLHSGWSKGQLEALAASGAGGRLEPMLVTLEPGGSSGSKAFASGREEFALVLDGGVTLTLDESELELASGDAVTIRPGALRRWRNSGEQPVRILIVAARCAQAVTPRQAQRGLPNEGVVDFDAQPRQLSRPLACLSGFRLPQYRDVKRGRRTAYEACFL